MGEPNWIELLLDWVGSLQIEILDYWSRVNVYSSPYPGYTNVNGSFVFDSFLRRMTIIPMYWDYRHLWVKNSLPSPFEYDWVSCYVLKDDPNFKDYLFLVIDSLEKQVVFYDTDSGTKYSFLVQYIKRYTRLLRALYEITY